MLDEQHTDFALGVDALDQLRELALLHRVGTRRRLVQQDDARIGAERSGDLQSTLFAVRQGSREFVGPICEPDRVEQGECVYGALLLLATLPRQAEHR